MTSFIPVAANGSRTLAYRAVEVEQAMKRNMLIALGISTLIHALIVASYYLFPSPAIDLTKVKWEKKIIWTNPPSKPTPNYVPSFGNAKLTDVRAGEPVPIPDVEASPNQAYPTQKDLSDGIPVGGSDNGHGNGTNPTGTDGEIVIPPDGNETEPPIFIPVQREPILVRRAEPKYPELMVKAGIEGKVWVKIWVNKQGKPHDVRIIKSDNEMFNDAAIEAAKQFLFTPAYMNNGPVSVWVSVPFTFKLQ